jgi:hypothetical protein
MRRIALSGNAGKGLYAIVDDFDYEMLSKHSWCLDVGGGYAMSRVNYKTMRMHRMILNPPNGLVVDHINRNKLDNRRSNLRIATTSQNMLNANRRSNNKSGFNGVTYSTRDKRWVAQVKLNYKNILLGYFKDKEDAINARKKWDLDYANSK